MPSDTIKCTMLFILLKTSSYAAMHMVVAIVIAYLLSGSWTVALAIGIIEPCVQTVAFFFHERAWHKIESKTDHHNTIIDSVSPCVGVMDTLLHKKD